MRKILVLAFICSTVPTFSFDMLPDIPQTSLSPMHDMQTMEAQRFRHEELDYYNDVKAEKKKFEKRNMTPEQKTQEVKEQIQQAVDKKYESMGHSEFVRENGQLKIKYGN